MFSGTTEGRRFSKKLAELGVAVTVCVATPLGAEEQGEMAGITVHAGRLQPDAMAALLAGADLCVDATHPYAVDATRNIRAAAVQDFSAVTGACLLVKTSVWDEVGGLDEAFAVAFNDVDFCLRVRDAGYRIAWTPYARLTHYESKSRGGDEKDPAKAARFASEQQRLYAIHGKEKILDDPYYNPSLTRDREDFSESDDLRKLKEGSLTVRWGE